ncbi:hypothetical protein CQ12_11415 [Bradyrhizobium jicamae]|uniref:Uncharacterized protein n=1 Tax=Bradyrhizobium jicamae TaxID=280332 RepID=A0A0R3LG54_9BRAD|nr:hypothetical protein [Bradyrhizobium jicamae]KRR06190.1 hypothetical protein CQ12_11415 [Bradyrhizobium jicamae]
MGGVQPAAAANFAVSYAGLTRVSIMLRKSLAEEMDGRVKPGHDNLAKLVPKNKKPASPPAFIT